YWKLGSKPWEAEPRLQQREMSHACEWETSMILRLDPKLSGPLQKIEPVSSGDPFEPAARGWITQDRSTPGHIGDPRSATAEKGEALFRVFADDVVGFLERVVRWDGKSWNG